MEKMVIQMIKQKGHQTTPMGSGPNPTLKTWGPYTTQLSHLRNGQLGCVWLLTHRAVLDKTKHGWPWPG